MSKGIETVFLEQHIVALLRKKKRVHKSLSMMKVSLTSRGQQKVSYIHRIEELAREPKVAD
jgi:hypothetical protein